MTDPTIIMEWLTFAFRWLHVIVAIAWIGSSFYFIALDLGLRKTEHLPDKAKGEEWQVHGGGFYHITKYMVAPSTLPEHLIWFKWESYSTWLSGFAMLILVYYLGNSYYLVDIDVLDMPKWIAVLISLFSLMLGWLIYDLLCKSPLGKSQNGLMLVLFAVLVSMAWGYAQIFSGRAALLHLGAFTATIMSANVFFLIIPNQKIVVKDLKAGRTPAAHLGAQAKQRSLHNNYLTLPVIFLMLSVHYPLAFATQFNWLIASIIFLIGVLIRHYFNSKHARIGKPNWTWFLALALFVVIIWLSSFDKQNTETIILNESSSFYQNEKFSEVNDIVLSRCSMCHTKEPFYEGIGRAPKDIILDSEADIVKYAKVITLQSGYSSAMPPGNITYMENSERQIIVKWYLESVDNKS
ncbi:MAG: urate hydroxylase PuuD [Devosiaceae bacterium]|nr:urate hydroxylase PuuD [Devosiaceae bacterium]